MGCAHKVFYDCVTADCDTAVPVVQFFGDSVSFIIAAFRRLCVAEARIHAF